MTESMTASMSHLFLFARIAGVPVSMPSVDVEAVIRMGEIAPIPRVGRGVVGLTAMRSRVLTVIDPRRIFGLPRAPQDGEDLAVVTHVDGHAYAILIDSVSDICVPDGATHPVSNRPASGIGAIATAHVQHEGQSFLLIDPAAIIESASGRDAA